MLCRHNIHTHTHTQTDTHTLGLLLFYQKYTCDCLSRLASGYSFCPVCVASTVWCLTDCGRGVRKIQSDWQHIYKSWHFHWSPLEGTVSNTTAGLGTTKYNRIRNKNHISQALARIKKESHLNNIASDHLSWGTKHWCQLYYTNRTTYLLDYNTRK